MAFFPHKTNKLCHIVDKVSALQHHKQKFWRDWLFWSSFTPKAAHWWHIFNLKTYLETLSMVNVWLLSFGHSTNNNEFCMCNELKYYIDTLCKWRNLSKNKEDQANVKVGKNDVHYVEELGLWVNKYFEVLFVSLQFTTLRRRFYQVCFLPNWCIFPLKIVA